MTKNTEYSEKDITRLKGLEGVRRRPTMYLGERGNPMVFQMCKEIIDNCLDEYLAGRNKSIYIHVDNKSGVYTVADEAEGIPVGLVPSDPENPKSKKVSILTLIFTELHTGGKIGSKAYASSRGVHGVGASAVNAISTSFEVWTRREGKLYYQAFKDSKPVGSLDQVRSIPAAVQKSLDKKYSKGTIIRFSPDQKIVSADKSRAILELGYTAKWLRFVAMLNPGLSVTLSDGTKVKTFINKKGISYLVDKRVEDDGLTPLGLPFIYQSPSLSCVLRWTDYAAEDGVSTYVCSGLTRFGGEHENGMRNALFKALKEHTLAREKFTAKDLYIGLVGILDFRMSEAEYTGQTKEKLASKVAPQVEAELYGALKEFFAKKKSLARNIIKRAIAVTKSKEAFKETLKAAVNAKKSKGSALPGVLASCPRAKPEEREIYLVEGDSASGCFVGNTKVQLLNGEVKTFKQLVKDHEKGLVHYGYAHDNSTGKLKVVKFVEPRLVKHVTDLVEVTLDNGQSVKCTLSHPWKLRSGQYVRADQLQPGDSLMPHYERFKNGRRQVWHPSCNPAEGNINASNYSKNNDYRGTASVGEWQYVYRLSADCTKALSTKIDKLWKKGIKSNVHHTDFDIWDDRPTNLEVLSETEHRALHLENSETVLRHRKNFGRLHQTRMKTDPEYYERMREVQQRRSRSFWQGKDSKKHKAAASERTARLMQNPELRAQISVSVKAQITPEWRENRSKAQSKINARPGFQKQRVGRMKEGYRQKFLAYCTTLSELTEVEYNKQLPKYLKLLGRQKFFLFSFWKKNFDTFAQFKKAVAAYKEETPYNHKVVGVRFIKCSKPVPVYDATVPKYHNYALACGVYVHNTAKKARNPNFQEILAINGKIANAATAKPVKLLASEAIRNILLSIGYNFDAHKGGEISHKLRVGSIYLLPDADVDGGHIAVLLLTLIQKFLPELFAEKRVYIVDAPLFTAFYKGKRYFGDTLLAVQKQMPKGAPKGIIMRSKGWGEIDFETLSEIAFNPKTRSVIQVQPIKGKELQYFERIVGAESAARKELLGI